LIAVVLAAAAVVCCGAVLDKETKERLTAVAASFAAVTAALSASNTALSLTIAAVSSTLLAGAGVVIRDEWVRQRGQSWWEGDAQHFNDEEFREHFRVCKATFTYLVERLRPLIQKQDTRLHKAKPAELLVALTLRKRAQRAHLGLLGRRRRVWLVDGHQGAEQSRARTRQSRVGGG